MLGDPLIEQRAGLGSAGLVLCVQDVEEKVIGGVRYQLGESLLALVAKGESFEEAERFGDAGHWF
jgi:hypothetical protein